MKLVARWVHTADVDVRYLLEDGRALVFEPDGNLLVLQLMDGKLGGSLAG